MTQTTRHSLAQTLVALAGMLGCVLAGVALHLTIGSQGRDPTAGMSFAALLLGLLAAWLCGCRGYRASTLLAALGIGLLLGIAAIGLFAYGGMPRLEPFFLSWFGGVALLLAVPWLLGLALGRWWRRAGR
jgi:hypothetical protein